MTAHTILVTGASGFVGRHLLDRLLREPETRLIAATRSSTVALPPGTERLVIPDGVQGGDWSRLLRGVTHVVHAAARVHQTGGNDDSTPYWRDNVDGTRALAEGAAVCNVRRLVFLSSIKVHGESTSRDRPFTIQDAPAPRGSYAESKLAAEMILRDIERRGGPEVVILRPPLVYGPGVRANFGSMMRWLQRGVPLPLASVDNLRSLLAVQNLVDAIVRTLDHPRAAGQIFLISDGEDLSTPNLLRRVAVALGTHARLISLPRPWMVALGRMAGQAEAVSRLLDSLRVDISHIRQRLDWSPPLKVDEAFRLTAEAYLHEARL